MARDTQVFPGQKSRGVLDFRVPGRPPESGFWGVGGDVGRKLVLMCTEV